MTPQQREDHAIERWRAAVELTNAIVVSIVSRPDREQPGRRGCDAIAQIGSERIALEHTTLDPYQDRRLDDDRFRRVVMPIVPAVESAFPDSWVELEIPVHAIPTGHNWQLLSRQLRDSIINALSKMQIARYYDLSRTRFDFTDIPFPVWISRQPVDVRPRCIIFRQAPTDVYQQLERDIQRGLVAKSNQLAPYRQQGYRGVLLLDFDDVVLLNQDLVAGSFARAAAATPEASLIDDVYLVDARRMPAWIFPVQIGNDRYPTLPAFERFFRDQYGMKWGTHS